MTTFLVLLAIGAIAIAALYLGGPGGPDQKGPHFA